MKRNFVIWALVIVLAALIGISVFFFTRKQADTAEVYAISHISVSITEDRFEELEQYTELETVDFQDSTCYDRILEYAQDHPEVSVTYRVDLGGTKLTNHDTGTELAVGSFDHDTLISDLRYLPELRAISFPLTDLSVAQLEELCAAYPDLDITWTVSYQGAELAFDTVELTIEESDVAEVSRLLAYLPQLQDLTFSGTAPALEDMLLLKSEFAEIMFHWNFELFGVEVDSDMKEIDLSGIPMESVEELENSLAYFNGLNKVILCDSGLPSSEIDALWKRHPETRFVWNVQIGRFNVRTDITYLMPNQFGYYGVDYYSRLRDEDCREMKYLVDLICLDMGHMHITDISFVKYMPNLEYLVVGDSRVKDLSPLAGAQNLRYLEAFLSGVEDISALAYCPALEDVNLCHNLLKDYSALMELEDLKNIWIAGNYISKEERALLEAAHPDAKIVYDLEGSTGAGWRELPNYYAMRDILGMPYMVG